jgi:diaminohydroxyphosphoribosylaminopyrimidine deaminase / 5-amino-6-(5-phosphoribosylamino)uracil reductase
MPESNAAEDRRFMALALALGRRGLGNTWPNPAVSAIVVRSGEIAGRGWTQPGGRPHAETEALSRAGDAARGATLYVSLEPCSHHGKTPPCTDAIIAAGIGRVVSAVEDPNPKIAGRGHKLLRAAGIAVDTGVCAEAALRAHAGHIRRVRDGRPHVTLKLAVSSDGKAGLAGRKPAPITGEAARARVHLLRAMNDAVLIGIGTALADDPQLTCRLPGMAVRSPVRVVLDAALRLPPDGKLVRGAAEVPVWAIAAPADAEHGDAPPSEELADAATASRAAAAAERALAARGVVVMRCAANRGRIVIPDALALLAGSGITRLMVEGGPTVAAAFLAADLVDEAVLLRGPRPIGADGIDALEAMPLTALTASPRLCSRGIEAVGEDTIETFARA